MALGEPTEYADCPHCGSTVGGPYYERTEARARLREHVLFRHPGMVKGREPSGYVKPLARSPRDFC